MRLSCLHLNGFRAHESSSLTLAPGVNLLLGPNGAGKTNVLEAIHFLAFGKSFLTPQDSIVLRRGAPFFEVRGDTQSDCGATASLRVAYVPEEGKRVFRNGVVLERMADLVGRLPIVLISPADHLLTAGGPEERRRLLDGTLSVARPAYLNDLLRYRRALKQRNALLLNAKHRGSPDAGSIEAYSEELVSLGSRLMRARAQFIVEFEGFLERAYEALREVGEQPGMHYQSLFEGEGLQIEEIEVSFRRRLQNTARREVQLGRTMVGPHRDEVLFTLNGFEVRPYASQGQHRTFGLALQLARYFFLKERLDENPVLLLDDVFGVLDPERRALVLDLLSSGELGQSLITAASGEPFASTDLERKVGYEVFKVAEGTISGAT